MSSKTTLFCLATLAISTLLSAQTPPTPTVYTISEDGGPPGSPEAIVISRNGSKALMDVTIPAQAGTPARRSFTLFDLKTGTQYSWDPALTPAACSVGRFSGDWGDPFAGTDELTGAIAKGDLKPTGTENIGGTLAQIYEGVVSGSKLKAWLDKKDNLVMRVQYGTPGTAAMTTMVDIKKLSFTPPQASIFALPATCASTKPPQTEAERIASETGDSAANFVNGNTGPQSKDSCSIILRVVNAGDMAPITRYQAAIDTTYNVDNPPHYVTGVGTDGTETFSGGGMHEITSQIHNGILRIDNPPPYFNLDVNLINPGMGSSGGLIYRQCFSPQTVLLYVVKDRGKPSQTADWLWVKSGKYAVVPPTR
jgi:hypothetical protein